MGLTNIAWVSANNNRFSLLSGSDCNNPTQISSIPYQQSGLTTDGAGDDYNSSPCGSDYISGDDYVFAYTPSGNEYVTVRLQNVGIFTGLHVLDACPDVATECLGSDLSQQAGDRLAEDIFMESGKTYYIIVSTFSAPQNTSFDILVEQGNPPPPGTDCGNTFPITSLPFNDLNRNTAEYDDIYSGSGPCQTDDYLNGNEIIYTYTPALKELVSLRATNISGFFAGLHVFDACLDANPDCIASVVNEAKTTDLEIENLSLEANQTYYIVLSTWENPQSFTYDLNIISERSCEAPTNFRAEEITEDGALVSWTPSGSVSNLLIVGAGQEPEGTGLTLKSDTFRFTGLAADQSYDVYLRSQCIPDALMIIGVYDGPLSGGNPKGVELYVVDDIDDLSNYGIGSANNGEGTDGIEFTFPAVAVPAGTHLHFTSDRDLFHDFFGFYPDYVDPSALVNGDDAVELFYNDILIDRFGDVNVDGTGEVWEYKDGWAYREANWSTNGGDFNPNKWTYSGRDVLEGGPTNGSCDVPFPVNSFNGPALLYSAWVGPVSFTTAAPDPICGGDFFDKGGASDEYPSNRMDTITICPDEPGYEVMLRFSLFDVEANGNVCVDNFYIFDGENTEADLITATNGGDSWCWDQSERIPTGSGNLENKDITSSHESGCLTIVFHSNSVGINEGWEAEVICQVRPFCPSPENLQASGITESSAVLEWTSIAPQVESAQISWGEAGITPEQGIIIVPDAFPYVLSDLMPSTAYEFYIRESCGSFGVGEWTGPVRFFTACSSALGDDMEHPIVANNLPYSGFGSTESCYSNTLGHASSDAFYAFTTDDCVYAVSISTCNASTNFDTYLHLLDADGTVLAVNDDAKAGTCDYRVGGVNRLSTLNANVEPNKTYYAVVEGFGLSEGDFQIDIEAIELSSLDLDLMPRTISCAGESDGGLALTVYGGAAPYSYYWSNGADTEDVEGLEAGVYTVTVEDACGQISEATIVLDTPTPIEVSAAVTHTSRVGDSDGSIELTIEGGQAPFTYLWSNQETTRNLIDLQQGTYCVTITDNTGCTTQACETVSSGLTSNTQQPELITSLTIQPNPTTDVSMLKLNFAKPVDLQLKVIDATGHTLIGFSDWDVKQLIYNLDFIDYPNGVYFLQLVFDEEVYTKRIIVSR